MPQSKLDELIAQCQAAPDDDAPRLAWANEVGGERGELVLVQCRLASGAVTNRDEWRRLRTRERELLFANGVEWSGLAGEYPSKLMFRRGFVDSLQVVCSYDTRLDRILAKVPLARSVANMFVDRDDYDFAKLVANPRCSELAALRVGSDSAIAGDRAIQQLVDHGVVLRALSVAHCSRAGARLLEQSGLLARVERLALGSVEDGARIIAAAPRLRALSITGALDRYAAAIPRTVVELGCHVSGGIDAVASLAIAPTLERLRVAGAGAHVGLRDARGISIATLARSLAFEAGPAIPAVRDGAAGGAALAPRAVAGIVVRRAIARVPRACVGSAARHVALERPRATKRHRRGAAQAARRR